MFSSILHKFMWISGDIVIGTVVENLKLFMLLCSLWIWFIQSIHFAKVVKCLWRRKRLYECSYLVCETCKLDMYFLRKRKWPCECSLYIMLINTCALNKFFGRVNKSTILSSKTRLKSMNLHAELEKLEEAKCSSSRPWNSVMTPKWQRFRNKKSAVFQLLRSLIIVQNRQCVVLYIFRNQ